VVVALDDIEDEGDDARLRDRCDGSFFKVRWEGGVFEEGSTFSLNVLSSQGKFCFEARLSS
jgi:hypothetical protein